MSNTKVASRYAKSLLGLATEQKIQDKVYDDMSLVVKTCTDNRDFSLLLKNPIVNTDKKDAILNAIFKGKITGMSLSFLEIITRKKREYYIEEIAREFVNIYKVGKGVSTAKIITAAPLDEKLRTEILDFLRKKTNRTIELTEVVDKEIIGGYILRWGDEQVDASISKKLRELHQEFGSNLYEKEFRHSRH